MSVCKTWFFIDTMITYFKYVVFNFFFVLFREESFPYKGKGTWSDFNLKQLRGISHYKFLCLETKSFVRILCEMANKHTTNVLRHTQQNIQVKHFIFFWIIIKNIYVGNCELVTNINFIQIVHYMKNSQIPYCQYMLASNFQLNIQILHQCLLNKN